MTTSTPTIPEQWSSRPALLEHVLDAAVEVGAEDRAFLAEIRQEDPEQVRSTGSRER